MSTRTPEPMPVAARRALIAGAVLMIVVAAAVNISHTRRNAADLGADYWTALVIGLLPDTMLVGSVVRLRYDRRSAWAWAGVAGSVSLVAWSALATAGHGHGLGGQIMALVCLTAAIIATGQAHVPAAEDPGIVIAHVEALAEDVRRSAEASVRAAEDAARDAIADAQRVVREAQAVAAETAREASAQASAMAVRVAEAEASADAVRAQLADAQQAVREASAQPSGKRPATVRGASGKASAQPSGKPSDVQRWRDARDGYKASVRAGQRWPNEHLACALAGCTDACADGQHAPSSDALTTARKRASDWRREVEVESSGQAASGDR